MFLKCNDKKIELHPTVWEYLYPYLLRFSIKHNIDWTIWKAKDVVYIPEDKREELIFMLEYIFEELMAECYKEPTQRQSLNSSNKSNFLIRVWFYFFLFFGCFIEILVLVESRLLLHFSFEMCSLWFLDAFSRKNFYVLGISIGSMYKLKNSYWSITG